MRVALLTLMFPVVAVVTYFVLVFASLWIAGDGVSCYRRCSEVTNWLDNAYPWPMIGGIAFSLGLASLLTWIAARVSRPF